MKIIVFCGPTIDAIEASKYIDAEFKPPAKHGDVISCVYNDRPDVIVLIDGVFISDLSVWNNEINEALNIGVVVYGASAMGAIRAAEMETWGMVGVGEVFKQYSDASIEADDEVFCDFSIVNGVYNRKTISIVNLRYILSAAVEDEALTVKEADGILNIAQRMYYENRLDTTIVQASVKNGIIAAVGAESLLTYIRSSSIDIQKQDAIDCLITVRRLPAEKLEKNTKNYQYDLFFEALYERDRGTKNGQGYHPFYKIANDYAMYSSDVENVNDAALNRKICALVADNFNIDVSEKEIEAERDLFVRKLQIVEEEDYLSWLSDNDMTEEELAHILAERVKISKLQNWYRTRLGFAKNTRYLLEELKLNNQYVEWKEKSIELQDRVLNHKERVAKTFNDHDISRLATVFLKHNPRTWQHAPFNFINKIGMNMQSFKYLLARDKTLSDIAIREIYNDV